MTPDLPQTQRSGHAQLVILCGDLSKFFSLNLDTEVLDCFEPLYEWTHTPDILYEHIHKCYPSLGATLVQSYKFSRCLLLPKRLQQFAGTLQFESSSQYGCHLPLLSHLAWPLLHYCNMHCAPKELKIDCYALSGRGGYFLDLFGRDLRCFNFIFSLSCINLLLAVTFTVYFFLFTLYLTC